MSKQFLGGKSNVLDCLLGSELSSMVVSALHPQRRVLTKFSYRMLSVQFLHIYGCKEDSWLYLFMMYPYLYIQRTKKVKTCSFTFILFNLGRKPLAHISSSCHTDWVTTCKIYNRENENKICKDLHNVFQPLECA